jgi:peroxiredoxin
MSGKKYRRQSRRLTSTLPIVAGLILIGLALAFITAPVARDPATSMSSVIPAAVHFDAPELSLENLNGQTESLADYQNIVVLVNHWATWCPPCKAEMPTLAAYFNEHRSQGFTIIAIEAGDPAEVVLPFVQSYRLDFPIWLDPDGASLRAFGNRSLPNSYVIDRTGTVRYAWTGEVDKATLETYVTPLLTEDS